MYVLVVMYENVDKYTKKYIICTCVSISVCVFVLWRCNWNHIDDQDGSRCIY